MNTKTPTPIEIPQARAGTLYHFDELVVGGPPIVVFVSKRGSLESCAWRAAKRINAKRKKGQPKVIFTVRFFEHNGTTKVGCWRLN